MFIISSGKMLSFVKKPFFICIMLGLTMGLLLFASRFDVDFCPYFSSSELCYAAVGSVSAGLSFAAWPLLNPPFKTYLALASTLPISEIFDTHMSILIYTETLKPIKNMYSVVDVTMDTMKCYYEEYSPESFADILLSLDDSLLKKMNKSDIIKNIASSSLFDSAERNNRKYYIELWSSVKESIQKVGGMMDYAYYYDLILQTMKYIAVFTFILYPMVWYRKYKRGSLKVNKTPSDWKEVTMLIFDYTWDLLCIAVILCGDYFYQKMHAHNYESSISQYKSYQGGDRFTDELSRRLAPCARLASPIDYGYETFLLAFVMRIVYIYGTFKLAWIPTFFCVHFNKFKYGLLPT